MYAIVHGEAIVLIYVNLDNANAFTHLVLELFEDGMHRLAGAAPGGEEIDQGEALTVDDIVEIGHNI